MNYNIPIIKRGFTLRASEEGESLTAMIYKLNGGTFYLDNENISILRLGGATKYTKITTKGLGYSGRVMRLKHLLHRRQRNYSD